MSIKNVNTGKTAKEMKELLLQEQTISASGIPEQPEPCQIPSPAPQIPEPLQSSQTLQQIYENQSYLAQLEIYKTQLAEITCQLDNYRLHYQQFETMIQSLISQQNQQTKHTLIEMKDQIKQLQTGNQLLNVNIEKTLLTFSSTITETCRNICKDTLQSEMLQFQKTVEKSTGKLTQCCSQLEMKGKQYLKTIHDSWKEFRKTSRIQQYLIWINLILTPFTLLLYLLSALHVIEWIY